MARLSRRTVRLAAVIALLAVSLGAIRLATASVGTVAPIVDGTSPLLSQTTTASQAAAADVSVRNIGIGLTGRVTTNILTYDLAGDGGDDVLLGTSLGVNVLSEGALLYRIPTSGPVQDMALLGTDGATYPALALAVGDTNFANIRSYDTATGEKLWEFAPRQEVFLDNLMWVQQQTHTFDIEPADLNGDGSLDVLATSGYYAYAIDGTTGRLPRQLRVASHLLPGRQLQPG